MDSITTKGNRFTNRTNMIQNIDKVMRKILWDSSYIMSLVGVDENKGGKTNQLKIKINPKQ